MGTMVLRSATADAPSATPISTRLVHPRANFSIAWCSSRVCCAIGGRSPAQAKKGCFKARDFREAASCAAVRMLRIGSLLPSWLVQTVLVKDGEAAEAVE